MNLLPRTTRGALRVTRQGNTAGLHLEGEVDLRLRQELAVVVNLEAQRRRSIYIDMRGVLRLDAHSATTIIDLVRLHDVAIRHSSPEVARVLAAESVDVATRED